jgi:hypothetical protein
MSVVFGIASNTTLEIDERRGVVMSRRAESVLVQRYPQLVRTAYLTLAGERRREERLARAHRVVQSALPWRNPGGAEPADVYRNLQVRVVKRTVSEPWWSRRWPWRRSATWLRATPALGTPEHAAVDAALVDLHAEARAAYALLVGEGLAASEITRILREAGVKAPRSAVVAAQDLRDRLWDDSGLGPDSQTRLLQDAALDPTVARLRPPDLLIRRALMVLRTGAVLAAVAALVFAITAAVSRPGGTDPVPVTAAAPAAQAAQLVAAEAWRTSSELSLDVWPSRGSRRTDSVLRDTAVRAWQRGEHVTALAGTASGPPVGMVRTLYAGDLDGQTVVLLADDVRIARYVDAGKSRTVTLAPKPRRDPVNASALRLTSGTTSARYLLAPWVSKAEATVLGGGWRALIATDGVTGAVGGGGGGAACWSGPVLRLTAGDVHDGAPFTLADFGAATPAHARYVPPVEPGPITGPQELDARGGPAVWNRLGCALTELRGATLDSVTAWELWSGDLPENAGRASWVCTRADGTGGANRAAADLVMPGAAKTQRTAVRTATRLCSQLAPDLVVATWWKAPSGKWYFLAAGSRNVGRITLSGLNGRTTRGDGLVAVGPFDAAKPNTPVTVRASNERGQQVPVI